MGKQFDTYTDLIKPHEIDFRLSRFVITVMERLENTLVSNNRGLRGSVFEFACLDMLLKEVDRAHICDKKELHIKWPKASLHDVDLDISLINEDKGIYIPFLLKTSFRERWKQCDRDASLANTCVEWRMLDTYMVFYNEYPKAKNKLNWKTKEQRLPKIRDKCREYELKCSTRLDCLNMYDTEVIDKVFLNAIARVTE